LSVFFAEPNVASATDFDMLEFFVVSATDSNTLTFQHVGDCPHFAGIICGFSDENFPQKCTERRGCWRWPPSSPDLTTFDFLGLCPASNA
jgi:hypothetical protein